MNASVAVLRGFTDARSGIWFSQEAPASDERNVSKCGRVYALIPPTLPLQPNSPVWSVLVSFNMLQVAVNSSARNDCVHDVNLGLGSVKPSAFYLHVQDAAGSSQSSSHESSCTQGLALLDQDSAKSGNGAGYGTVKRTAATTQWCHLGIVGDTKDTASYTRNYNAPE